LAAQLRQLDRETGPDEPRLVKKYAPIGALYIRSTWSDSGIVSREIGTISGTETSITWRTMQDADLLLMQKERRDERARLVARMATRLANPPATLEEVPEVEMRLLRMSNTEYDRWFRAQEARNAPAIAGGGALEALPPAQTGTEEPTLGSESVQE